MAPLKELDTVIVRQLDTQVRPVDGTPGRTRQPLVGDEGAVVHVLGTGRFTVECVDDGGATVWLADFDAHELAPPPSGWRFTVEEVSPGAYRASGLGPGGANVASTDTDPTVSLATCRRFAVRVRPTASFSVGCPSA